MVTLDTICGEFEALGNAKLKEAERVALLLVFKEALQCPASNPAM